MTENTQHEKTLRRYIKLLEQREAIDAEIHDIKTQLATLGTGTHTILGLKITVSEPSRRFNLDRALTYLNDEQKRLSLAPSPALVKQFLPPVLLEQSMDPGTGDPVVKVS